MSLRIYDTRAKRKIDWAPPPGRQIGFYACGITPYDLCHVGHARFLVAFDIIVRHLRSSGLDVRFVRNVTDIDDKIIRRGHAEGRSAAAVALEYTAAMELLAEGSPELVVVQHSVRHSLAESYGALERTRVVKQGDNALSFFTRAAVGDPELA